MDFLLKTPRNECGYHEAVVECIYLVAYIYINRLSYIRQDTLYKTRSAFEPLSNSSRNINVVMLSYMVII